ncbi:MAG: glycosyltransferase [Terracidiphilus sp.]|nr:glycosyltransferase [Terracidiphilus sp.]
MTILHIIDTFSPTHGGPPEAVRQLVKAYLEVGAEIEVLSLDSPDAPYLKDIPCPVHALGQCYLGRFAYSPRLKRWLEENAGRFDGIVMNGIWSYPGVALRRAAHKAGTPYGVFVHGALDPWFNRKYPLKHLKKLFYWRIQYAVLRDALAVFFTTDEERRLARESFQPSQWNSVVVPYGITDPKVDVEAAKRQVEEFYEKIPQLRGRHYLLFMGRIHEKKGCDLLIEAFASQAARAPDLDLVIAGPDQTGKQKKLQHRAEQLGIGSRVHWPGMISGDMKWGALRGSDAFILPSHQENFGIVVVESLAMGRPVLISNQVNIWPDIEADGVGLVDDDTQEGTERMLSRWISLDESVRAEMRDASRQAFIRRYAMSRTARVINRLFEPIEKASLAVQ